MVSQKNKKALSKKPLASQYHWIILKTITSKEDEISFGFSSLLLLDLGKLSSSSEAYGLCGRRDVLLGMNWIMYAG